MGTRQQQPGLRVEPTECSGGCVCHRAASSGRAAGAGALALPPSTQGRGAEVRGGCLMPLEAVAASPRARQVRGYRHACAGCLNKLTTAGRASGPLVRAKRPAATLAASLAEPCRSRLRQFCLRRPRRRCPCRFASPVPRCRCHRRWRCCWHGVCEDAGAGMPSNSTAITCGTSPQYLRCTLPSLRVGPADAQRMQE